MERRRLYRSRQDRRIAGVAGGIGDYLDVDPTVIRVLWILSLFFMGMGILLYIILAFVMPLEPLPAPAATGTPGGYVPATTAPASEATAADNPVPPDDGS